MNNFHFSSFSFTYNFSFSSKVYAYLYENNLWENNWISMISKIGYLIYSKIFSVTSNWTFYSAWFCPFFGWRLWPIFVFKKVNKKVHRNISTEVTKIVLGSFDRLVIFCLVIVYIVNLGLRFHHLLIRIISYLW